MSKPDSWMPLYVADYLADTLHLTRDEHGAYFLLMMAYWRNGGPLLDDDKRLASIAKASPKEWKDLRPAMEEFFTVADGVWTHKRIDQEHEKAAGFIAKQKANGAKGGRPSKTQSKNQNKPMGFDRDTPNESPSPSPIPNPLNPNIAAASTVPIVGSGSENLAAAADAVNVRATELAVLLYRRGAQLQSSDPRVREWAETGVTDAQALTALETAQKRRSEKGSAQAINAGYLHTLIMAGREQSAGKPSPHSIPPASAFSGKPVAADGSGRPLAVPELDLEGIQ